MNSDKLERVAAAIREADIEWFSRARPELRRERIRADAEAMAENYLELAAAAIREVQRD